MNYKDTRFDTLSAWLANSLNEPVLKIAPASEDASFRRYFRLHTESGSYIAMDAPPDKEPIADFVKVAQALENQQVHAPKIYASDAQLGFILLEDLGNQDYLDHLAEQPNQLYQDAIASLIKLQRGIVDQPKLSLNDYDPAHLKREMGLFEDWYVAKHLGLKLSPSQKQVWANTNELLVEACLEQPQVWVHRDFHSRNLMLLEQDSPGVIDFQDLLRGPLTYDLASLFKDCYIRWPRKQQLDWCQQYFERVQDLLAEIDSSTITQQQFVRWFDLTGLQRHLKVLGIFCRLNYRDGKTRYMDDLPMVRAYVEEVLTLYPELNDFALLFEQIPHA